MPDYSESLIVGNERSKRYYVPPGRGYRRALRQKNLIFFDKEEDAIDAGFTSLTVQGDPELPIAEILPDLQSPEPLPRPPVGYHVIRGPKGSATVEINHPDDKRT